MASFSAGITFSDGVANDVTAAKLGALVNNATPTSGLIQDRTTETITATNDTLLFGDASDSNNLKKITVANFAQTLPTASITTGTIGSATLGTTTGTAATITTGTIPTLSATTLLTVGTGTASAPSITVTGDTNNGVFFPAADTIAATTNGTERLRIDSSGNVGIGTSSPTAKLDVVGGRSVFSPASEQYGIGVRYVSTGGPVYFGAASSSATPDAVISNAGGAALMTLQNGGNVGIGTTSPSYRLQLSTDSAAKPSTNTWTITSDERLKTNITPADLDRCYEILKTVPLKRYTWKNEVYSADQVKDRSKLGWIAQDVETVFPKAVGTNRMAYNQVYEEVVIPEVDSDGNPVLDGNGVQKTKTEKRIVSEDVIEDCKDLNSDQIYAVMYGTIQKLIAKVETLEAKNDSLKSRIEALEAA